MSRVSPLRATVATGLTLGTAALGLALAPAALAAGLTAPTAPASAVAGQVFDVTGAGCLTEDDPAYPDYEAYVAVTTDLVETDPETQVFLVDPSDAGDWSVQVHFPAGTTGPHEVWAICAASYLGEPAEYPAVPVDLGGTTSTASTPSTPATSATFTPTRTVRGVEANTPGVASQSSGSTTGATAQPGKKVVKVLTGFQPGEQVAVTLHSTPQAIGTFPADVNGVVRVEFVVPDGTPAGDHTLVYEGSKGTYFQESFKVSTGTASASGSLAYTGASIGLPLALGAGLLAAGGGVLVATRRRSTGASQA